MFCCWQPQLWAAGSMESAMGNDSFDYRSGPAGVHLSYMSRKWWRSEAHVATSPATSAVLMKSGLWFAGCLVSFRLLGYQHWGRVSAGLKFVSATVSLSACSKIGNTAFLQTVFPSWKVVVTHTKASQKKRLLQPSVLWTLSKKQLYLVQAVRFVHHLSRSWDKE